MRALAALSLVLIAACAGAQSPADALRGVAAPISAKDLPVSYRAVSLGGGETPLGGLGLLGFGMASGSGGEEATRSTILFSLIGVTFVDPDEFTELLEGKRPRIRGYALDFPGMVLSSAAKGRGMESRTPTPTFTETWIEAGRVQQWSPRPGLSRDLILKTFDDASGPKPAADVTRSLSDVKQIALGMIMYSGDYDDHLPKADSSPKAKTLVMPYIKSEEVWKSPSGGGYLYNTSLSGVSMTAIERPAETLLVWQEQPFPDGERAVGFTDGHAKRVRADEWGRLWSMELQRRQKAKMDAQAAKRPAVAARRP